VVQTAVAGIAVGVKTVAVVGIAVVLEILEPVVSEQTI